MAVERTEKMWKVDTNLIKAAKEADKKFWDEYSEHIHPDDRQYISYPRYLMLRLERATNA